MQCVEEGTILHLQRLSTEDGPGIRTTVFFKGCPLRCAWCHNPESISPHPQVQWLENRCIRCKTCLAACPNHALEMTSAGLVRDRRLCKACGKCAAACPANAHELLGQRIGVDALVKELLKDRAYYAKSGGGVTLSGGEPALQPGFALALLEALRQAGISTALDTCGLCAAAVFSGGGTSFRSALAPPETFRRLANACDLLLYDLKLLDGKLHRQLTGVNNTLILDNLRWLGEYLPGRAGKSLWVRTPLIPGATFTEENIIAVGAWLAANLPGQVARWELCAFNNLCRDKYRRLGLDWAYAATPLLSAADLQQAKDWAGRSGFDPARVFVTGSARLEG